MTKRKICTRLQYILALTLALSMSTCDTNDDESSGDSDTDTDSDTDSDTDTDADTDTDSDADTDSDVDSDGWLCYPGYFGSGDGCDCGCGIPDPDCGDSGCSPVECWIEDFTGCDSCYYENGASAVCDHTLIPEGWVCSEFSAIDYDCHCGCGAPDPACGDTGCFEAWCWQEDVTGCDICINDIGMNSYPCFDDDPGDSCPVGPAGTIYDMSCEPNETACYALADTEDYMWSTTYPDYVCDDPSEVCCAAMCS